MEIIETATSSVSTDHIDILQSQAFELYVKDISILLYQMPTLGIGMDAKTIYISIAQLRYHCAWSCTVEKG